MTKEQLAAQLNGREYRNEITAREETAATAARLVIVFGASDDLMEFRGAIHDELGAWDGETAYLIRNKGLWEPISESEYGEYMVKLHKLDLADQLVAHAITAEWCPDMEDGTDLSWLIKADIPHATFDIVEDDRIYCRGIVFSLADLDPNPTYI